MESLAFASGLPCAVLGGTLGENGTADVTVEIRQDIRGELRDMRREVTATNERLDATNDRLDVTNERLETVARRQVETEMRLATELVAPSGAVRDRRDVFVEDRALRNLVRDHETRIAEPEQKRPRSV